MINTLEEEMTKMGCDIQHTVIEQGYDTSVEVEKHLWADFIILQSPVYWFGMPWIYKKYVDEVFTAGMMKGSFITGDGRTRENPQKQYGTGGLLQGKKYMVSLTWNAPKEAFEDKSQVLFGGATVDDVVIANTANYKFCGVNILPAFACFDVMKNPDVEADIARLRTHLQRALAVCQ
jgi:modulator of drug activity B